MGTSGRNDDKQIRRNEISPSQGALGNLQDFAERCSAGVGGNRRECAGPGKDLGGRWKVSHSSLEVGRRRLRPEPSTTTGVIATTGGATCRAREGPAFAAPC